MRVKVYGASDDLMEVVSDDKSLYLEYDIYGVPGKVVFTRPDGTTAEVKVELSESWKVSGDGERIARIAFDENAEPDDEAMVLELPEGTVARGYDGDVNELEG